MVYFFQAGALLASKALSSGLFWPFFGILSRIYALFGAPFTGLITVVVPQTWQIWGMVLTSFKYKWSTYRAAKYGCLGFAQNLIRWGLFLCSCTNFRWWCMMVLSAQGLRKNSSCWKNVMTNHSWLKFSYKIEGCEVRRSQKCNPVLCKASF